MSETFVFNNIELEVNPTDITATQHRNLKTAQFIRDDATYTSKNVFSRTSYRISLVFDLNNSVDRYNLASMVTHADLYPFAFIQSKRLSSYVGDTYDATADFQIFGIESFTLTQSAKLQGMIFVDLALLHFNYKPFCKEFEFYSVSERKKKDRNVVPKSKQGEDTEVVPIGVTSPIESEIFASFFNSEIRDRVNKLEEFGTSEKPNSYFSIKYPEIRKTKPPEDSDFQEQVITVLPSISNPGTDGQTQSDKSTVWIKWNSLINSDNGTNLNDINRTVDSISVTKSNNFVTHNLKGWNLPVLQYMGKGPSNYQVNFCVDTDGAYEGNDLDNPITFMKYVISQMDVNYLQSRAYDAYNVMKIDCIMTALLPAFGFAIDSEGIQGSSSDQGKDLYSYVLKESDTRKLLDRKRYSDAGTKEVDVQASIMIHVISSITKDFMETNHYNSLTSQEKADPFLAVVTFYASAIGDMLYDSEAEQLYNVLIDFNKRLVTKEREIKEAAFEEANPGSTSLTYRYGEQLKGVRGELNLERYDREAEALENKLDAIDNLDLSNMTRILEQRLSPNGIFNEKNILRLDRELETFFYKIIRLADKGNKFCSAATQYADLLKDNYNNMVEDFEGEAIDDLAIGNRLGINKGALKKYGFEDARDIPPFFFIKQNRYLNSSTIKRYLDVVNYTDEQLREAINKVHNSNGPDGTPVAASSSKLEDADTSNVKLSSALGMSGKTELPEDTEIQSDIFKSDGEDFDPFNERTQSKFHAQRMTYTYEHGINLAFPALKVYLVEGEESYFSLKKNTYYELKGITSLRVGTNSDDNPVDALDMMIANPGSVYTDDHVAWQSHKATKDPELAGTVGENRFPINQMKIRPGNRLHVKAGYGNNPNELETIFNGVITSVGGESMLNISAEGFSRELIAYEHGDDPTEDNFFMSADTNHIIYNALYSDEIEHFGIQNFKLPFTAGPDPEARAIGSSPFGLFSYSRKRRLFTNIFVDSIDLDKFETSILNSFDFFGGSQVAYDFPIYRSTPWYMLKQMEYRHPGTLSKPVLYGDRYSYFFGIKEQLYVYRDLANELMKETSTLRNLLGPQNKDNLYDKLKSKRFKPVSDFHILSSDHNIIENKLRVTDNFNTVLNVQHYGDQSDIEDGNFDYEEIKMDDNLKPSAHRRGEFSMLGIHGKFMAYKYGSVGLRKEAEKMYDGTITLLGNPNIKAGDYAGLYDDYRSLRGIVKVRECLHEFSVEQGYVTKIIPGLYCESSHFDYSQLFSKLFIAAERAVEVIKIKTELGFQTADPYLRSSIVLSLANDVIGKSTGEVDQEKLENLTVAGASATSMVAIGYGAAVTLKKAGTSLLGHAKLQSFISKIGLNAANNTSNLRAASTVAETVITKPKLPAANMSRIARLGKGAADTALGIGKAAVGAARMAGPIGWAATSILIGLFSAKYTEIDLTRQPIRIYPLQLRGMQYIGGIAGYKEQGYFESIGDEWEETANKVSEITNYLLAKRSGL